jgi:hypothetical protein
MTVLSVEPGAGVRSECDQPPPRPAASRPSTITKSFFTSFSTLADGAARLFSTAEDPRLFNEAMGRLHGDSFTTRDCGHSVVARNAPNDRLRPNAADPMHTPVAPPAVEEQPPENSRSSLPFVCRSSIRRRFAAPTSPDSSRGSTSWASSTVPGPVRDGLDGTL